MEVLNEECDILRRQMAEVSSEESALQGQLMVMEKEHDRERREWEVSGEEWEVSGEE